MPLPLYRLGVSLFAAAPICLALSAAAVAGDPLTDIEINEVESTGVDFIELINTSGTPTDVSGLVLKDNDDSRTLAIAAGTIIPAGGFFAMNTDVPGGFTLDAPDAARVFLPDGVTPIDGTDWVFNATGTTYGRCPDGTGEFLTTVAVTKGAANSCISPLPDPWPGSGTVSAADPANVLGGDLSGLDYEGTGATTPGVLWAVNNGTSRLFRLVWDGSQWVLDTANGWSAGKTLRTPGSTSTIDAEGVTLTEAGSAGGVFVSSERNLASSATSRPAVFRYDVSGAGATLVATQEWNLTADLPPVGSNAGIESVEWIPDTYLVESGFVDEATTQVYDPADYPDHGTGVFFVGLEANGTVYGYILNQTLGTFTRIATFASGFNTFGALHWDNDETRLWVVCDNNCDGRSRIFEVNTSGAFAAVADFARPTEMPNLNNEGFTITPDDECVGGSKPVFWADDGNFGGHALRAGRINCRPPIASAGWSSSPGVKGDFNGDGFGDLAIGVRENAGAGAVHILPGSATGVGTVGSQFWSQDSAGVADTAEEGDDFGGALAAGDFNADGFGDLAIGAPGEDFGAGAVHVLFGGAGGLTATDSEFWTQASAGVGDDPEAGDRFGAALAAGNVNTSSSASELAIGVPGEDIGTRRDAGLVQVLRGTTAGLAGSGSQTLSQNAAGIADTAEGGDRFGSSLAVGNLGGSVVVDLAIGVPEEDVGATVDAGMVHVLPGSPSGLTATGSTLWSQNSPGVGDTAETGDGFGASLAIGNVVFSNIGDLVVGVPGEDLGLVENAGVVQVLRGTASGPVGGSSQLVSQATAGIADAPETGDVFGYAVAVGDFGGDAFLDLAAGAPGEGGANAQFGVVHVIPGSSAGLTAAGSQQWSQNSTGVADVQEANDRFGAALAASNYGFSNDDDLAIGVPGESSVAAASTGLVQVLRGSPTFLLGTQVKTFGQDTAGIADDPETLDAFGIALGR